MAEQTTLPAGTSGPVTHACGLVLEQETFLDQDDITTQADIPRHLRGLVDAESLPAEYRRFNRRGVLLYWWDGDREVKTCPRCGQPLPLGRALLPGEDQPESGGETGAPGGDA